MFLSGCGTARVENHDVRVDLELEPNPPVVGNADITVTLTDAEGKLVEGVDVSVEGNMNHAGMKPTFAELNEVAPGRYSGRLSFTMGGDWFVLVTAKRGGGMIVERKIDVRGVTRP
jgi:hypothetical protein